FKHRCYPCEIRLRARWFLGRPVMRRRALVLKPLKGSGRNSIDVVVIAMLRRACSSFPFAVALYLLIVVVATPLYAAPAATLHHLDPLTAQEITLAADTLKTQAAFPKDALFSTIALHEPPKQEVLDFKPGDAFRREAFAIVMDRANNKVFEAIVDLKA